MNDLIPYLSVLLLFLSLAANGRFLLVIAAARRQARLLAELARARETLHRCVEDANRGLEAFARAYAEALVDESQARLALLHENVDPDTGLPLKRGDLERILRDLKAERDERRAGREARPSAADMRKAYGNLEAFISAVLEARKREGLPAPAVCLAIAEGEGMATTTFLHRFRAPGKTAVVYALVGDQPFKLFAFLGRGIPEQTFEAMGKVLADRGLYFSDTAPPGVNGRPLSCELPTPPENAA